MYTLYVNKAKKEIIVSKASKTFHNCVFTNEVTKYNESYFLCLKRKPLVEKAKSIKEEWVKELEAELEKVKQIKL